MLKLDNDFYNSYFKYYGNIQPFEVLNKVQTNLQAQPGFNLVKDLNIVKTCSTLGQSYTEFYMEMYKKRPTIMPEADTDKDIFDVAFMYLYEADPKMLESFLDIRFKTRDVYKEITLDIYGQSSPELIENIKDIKTEDTYSIQKPNPESRDRWFYDLAVTVGSYSKCHSRKIGAVLVRDNSVISTGYNGPPRGVPTCDQRWYIDKKFANKYGKHIVGKNAEDIKGMCPRRVIGFPSGQGLEICPAGHAERNALINAARLGIKTEGTKLYMSCAVPCTPCMVEIINAGVEEIVCSSLDIYDETAMYLLENSDLKIRLFDFLL